MIWRKHYLNGNNVEDARRKDAGPRSTRPEHARPSKWAERTNFVVG
jgi:hypothetical protein